VHVQFLVGPVALGPKGQVSRILQVSEDRLDGGLAMIGADDFCRGPLMSVRHQDQATECAVSQSIEGRLVELVGEGEMGILAHQLEANDLAEMLAPLEVGLDVALDPCSVAPLLATSERVRLF
jgi:hypothetical protein